MNEKKTRSLPRRWPRTSTVLKQKEIDFSGIKREGPPAYFHKKSKSLDIRQLPSSQFQNHPEDNKASSRWFSKFLSDFCPRFGWSYNLEWKSNPKYDGRCVFIGNVDTFDLKEQIDPSKIQTQDFVGNMYKSSKYTIFNFLPYNLIQQFRRAANIYFICALLLTLLLPDAPLDPSSWLLSLLFVVCITMIKQGYEDFLRHRRDRFINERTVNIVRNGQLTEIKSKDIVVGDIIRLVEDEIIPCDAVVLSTSHDYGQCYVMTANLDGETSLKTKLSCKLTKCLRTKEDIQSLRGYVECEIPNPKIDSFLGRLTVLRWSGSADEEESAPLNQSNLIMASTQLKNTKEALVVCVYTGEQTKMSLNSRITKNKFSVVEKTLNKFLLFYGVVMLLQIIASTILTMQFGFEYYAVREKLYSNYFSSVYGQANEWYIGQILSLNFRAVVITALIWFTLFNFYIPISLYVTLEMQKMISSRLYRRDMLPRDPEVLCNTSDVNEDLGLVTHLFTDKTGTLTTNVMTFQKYADENLRIGDSLNEHERWSPLLMILTMCHSAKIESNNFVSSSPDEKALLEACRTGNTNYLGESMDGTISIKTQDGNILCYRKLDELEFDSYRKCMSVIVECLNTGKLLALTKGAESSMVENISKNYGEDAKAIVDNFAQEGLRTLVLGYRYLSEAEYKRFNHQAEVARSSVIERNRAKFVREAYSLIENDLIFAGITGIEDRLQEELPETLEAIREAGITIWMLTGDKKETAINIGQSSGLIPKGSNVIELCNLFSERDANMMIKQIFERQNDTLERIVGRCVLVIDGKTLSFICKSKDVIDRFAFVLSTMTSVIACRLSPIQKSILVRMVKKMDKRNFVTAAIGDGGNDISMIQEAHIGFGIVGLEGKGASKAADFAFSKFKYIRRTLLIHGYWFYDRVAYIVQYSFYKNVVCFFCQFLVAFYSNFSATSLYSGTFLMCFNTIYTSVPVLIFGLFERREPEDKLESFPGIYQRNAGNKQLKAVKLISWFCLGLWQAFIIFYGWLYTWPIFDSVNLGDLYCLGMVIAETTVLVTNFQILFDAKFFDPKLIVSIVTSVLGFAVITVIIQTGIIPLIADGNELNTYKKLFFSSSKWAVSAIVVFACIFPKLLIRSTYEMFFGNGSSFKSPFSKTANFELTLKKV